MRSPDAVPVSMGSPRFVTRDCGPFSVTDAWFPPDAYLAPHEHARTTFAVMLEGAFDLHLGAGRFPCPPGTAFTEPIGERHANRIAASGAHVVVIQPDPMADEVLRPVATLLEGIHVFRDGRLGALGRRLVGEVRAADSAAPLAVEALALEMLAMGARRPAPRPARRPDRWMIRAREFIHARFREAISVTDVARAAGVHPGHLARAFRARWGVGVAEYVRRLRVEWAAAELTGTRRGVATIALAAGFADQSHFTRVFRQVMGRTPAAFRRAPRG